MYQITTEQVTAAAPHYTEASPHFPLQSAFGTARILKFEPRARVALVSARIRFHGLVGQSGAMRRLYERIEAAGRTKGTILIVGETGSGKELVAQAIQAIGLNPKAPFLSLNCAALPNDLIESELFGHVHGAFSGANADYPGLFRAADGGTLFLDEVTEMSSAAQAKLLRALQEQKIRSIGSTKEVPVDVRIIASTNRTPAEAMRSGNLREDLYYRLQAGEIAVPPLREHLDDVPLLANHFMDRFNQRKVRSEPVLGIEPEAIEAMSKYAWPGNVRELANAIEEAFTFGRSPTIGLSDLPGAIGGRDRKSRPSPAPDVSPFPTLAYMECHLIWRALAMAGRNEKQAAEILKISPRRLHAKVVKYSLGDFSKEGAGPCPCRQFARPESEGLDAAPQPFPTAYVHPQGRMPAQPA